MDLTAPIDDTHRESREATDWLRQLFAEARSRALLWRPRPCPAEWEERTPWTS